METTLPKALQETNFQFENQSAFYKGKVRDVYTIGDLLVMIATDRISAFDHVLPSPIPYKGQVLNQIASFFLNQTRHIVPNWLIASPDPNVALGFACEPFKVEMVVRGYLVGHAWRLYNTGERVICGIHMPDGMKENEAFPAPVITPTTKAAEGHDEDISKEEILKQGIVSSEDYEKLEAYAISLFEYGSAVAKKQGLILVDTKYEFGKRNGEIMLIDEIHTPDSSRYFYADGYEKRLKAGQHQRQLSKEFVREWLMKNGFQGEEGQTIPTMPESFIHKISERYIELYEYVTGEAFIKADSTNIIARIDHAIRTYMNEKKDVLLT